MKRALPRIWNDWLALLLLVGLPLLWVFYRLPEILEGGTLAGWTLVVQYYFRRSPGNGEDVVPHG